MQLKRNRLVNNVLADEIKLVHSISMQVKTFQINLKYVQ
jgi:stress-induced morphogen